jgi:hypothetical protein
MRPAASGLNPGLRSLSNVAFNPDPEPHRYAHDAVQDWNFAQRGRISIRDLQSNLILALVHGELALPFIADDSRDHVQAFAKGHTPFLGKLTPLRGLRERRRAPWRRALPSHSLSCLCQVRAPDPQ